MSTKRPERTKRSTLWGQFCTLQEAKETAGGIEWWTKQDPLGRSVDVELSKKPLEGVPNMEYPVFLSDSGWMYIGDWVEGKGGDWLEHGFGRSLSCVPDSLYWGVMYIGNYKMGHKHGQGKKCWLPTSPVWKGDKTLSHSPITDPTSSSGTPLPFNYEGEFHYDDYYDPIAVVELPDGTRRQGPWKLGVPVGDFFQDHELLS